MTPETIAETLRLHALWLKQDAAGVRCILSDANLRGADLSGANLSGTTSYRCGGWDSRGYHFRAVLFASGVRITAGCRDFTLSEARAHWTAKNNLDALARAELLALLETTTP